MDFISKNNLVKAAIVGAGAMLAMKMLAGKSKVVQGVATIAVVAVALPLADKVKI